MTRRYVIAWHPPGKVFFLRGDGRRRLFIPHFDETEAFALGWRTDVAQARVLDGPLCFDPESLDSRWFSNRTLTAFANDTSLQDRLRIHVWDDEILPTQLYIPRRIQRYPPG